MPNHVANLLSFEGVPQRIAELKEFIKDGKNVISLQKIFPLKEEQMRRAIWGAGETFDTEEKDNGDIVFYTAWHAPVNVMFRLADKFPDITINHIYADEDYGFNCAAYKYRNGSVNKFVPGDESDEAMALFFATHPSMIDSFVKVGGEWTVKES